MANTGELKMGGTEWLLLIILSILWGGSFFFGEIALRDLPPFTIVFVRVVLAAFVLNLVVIGRGLRMPGTVAGWRPFAVMGLLNNLVPFSLIFWGQTQITSGLAAILNATTPVFAIVLAHVLTRDERLSVGKVAGVGFGVCGVVTMVGPATLSGLDLNAVAQFAVLTAALSYAFAGIFGRRFQRTQPLVTAAGQVSATAAMMVPVVLIIDRPWTLEPPQASTLGAMLGLGIASTAVAYIIYFRILTVAGATNLLLVTFLIPVSALTLGIVVLGESLTPYQVAGMTLIGIGLLVIDGRVLDCIPPFLSRKSDQQRM